MSLEFTGVCWAWNANCLGGGPGELKVGTPGCLGVVFYRLMLTVGMNSGGLFPALSCIVYPSFAGEWISTHDYGLSCFLSQCPPFWLCVS